MPSVSKSATTTKTQRTGVGSYGGRQSADQRKACRQLRGPTVWHGMTIRPMSYGAQLDPLFPVDVFHGQISPAAATIYARVPRRSPHETLRGTINGPFSAFHQTLPATISFRDCGPGQTVLASVSVPDPCCWTTAMPSLYDVHLEVVQDHEVVATYARRIGVRGLGVHGRSFQWAGKRWVLRGVRSADPPPIRQCREHDVTVIMSSPGDELCGAASQQGVFVVALLTDIGNLNQDTCRLARHPCVGIVGVTHDVDDGAVHGARQLAPNMLFAACYEMILPSELPDWAELAVLDCATRDDVAMQTIRTAQYPVVVSRRSEKTLSIPAVRAACDQLQRDLAEVADLAGYIV